MKKIRQNVFETNSSSTHSICIAKDAKLTIPNQLNFNFGEFGWEEDSLKTNDEKASYLYTGLIARDRHDDVEKIISFLNSKGIDVGVEKPIYETRSYTDNGVIIEYTSGQNIGYIDHSDELEDFLDAVCYDENKLMRYLFSDLSFIRTGNDNDEDSDTTIRVDYAHDSYFKGN